MAVVAALLGGCGQVGGVNGTGASGRAGAMGTVAAGDASGSVGASQFGSHGLGAAKVTITKITTTTSAAAGSIFIPPPNASQAEIAIAAAESQLGVPYVYAAADPGRGFDCSGLTMWAWGQSGVPLPHNAAKQYAALPHVSRSALQPGDLVFFYTPIEHVGIYVGGGEMIDAPYTGASVEKTAVRWPVYSGAARP